MPPLIIQENGLRLRIDFDAKQRPRLTEFAMAASPEKAPPSNPDSYQLLQIQGEQETVRYYAAMGARRSFSIPGTDFVYQTHSDRTNASGRKIEILTEWNGIEATVHWQFFNGIPVLRSWVELHNRGSHAQGLDRVGSFFFLGLMGDETTPWDESARIGLVSNAWCAELQWQHFDPRSRGFSKARENSSNRFTIANTGNWSTKEYLPLGVLENLADSCVWFWQIEHNGSWSWELGDHDHRLYLALQGPDESDGQWFLRLEPGQSFSSVPASVGLCPGRAEDAFAHLTSLRRRLRQPHPDFQSLPLIFNDYMNCLFADPTTERELPCIRAAAEAGAEIYVVDAGWYARRGESWWSSVGRWQPSPDRFEGGLAALMQTIRDHGMIPGLWLELEVMGVDCSLANTWPAECFFRRHGKPVVTRGRYQLDFRHPVVRAHSDEVVDRLVREYGAGYIKMDYNIDPGSGTETDSDSFGDGLLRHNRAYLDWLRDVFVRHPSLVIENCSSGGLRMDYALLALHPLQSISDQEDVVKMARIAATSAVGATPEQQAMWVYPKRTDSRERIILNCVNALLMRWHLSGELPWLSPENTRLVHEAVAVYKNFRPCLAGALPFWPLGLPPWDASLLASGLSSRDRRLVAVWNLGHDAVEASIPLKRVSAAERASMLFPTGVGEVAWDGTALKFNLPPGPCARLVAVSPTMAVDSSA